VDLYTPITERKPTGDHALLDMLSTATDHPRQLEKETTDGEALGI